MTPVCTNCAQPIRAGARFCAKCGAAQTPAAQPPLPPHIQPPTPPPAPTAFSSATASPVQGAKRGRLPTLAIALLIYLVGAAVAVLLGQRVAASAAPPAPPPAELPVMPREAGQKGLDWLLDSAVTWQRAENCYGCHVQSFAVLGAAAAHANGYTINRSQADELIGYLASIQSSQGYITGGSRGDVAAMTQTALAGIGMGEYDAVVDDAYADTLVKMADWLVGQQSRQGHWALDHDEPPVDQGDAMTTGGALITLAAAQRHQPNAVYTDALEKGADWLRTVNPQTTQDALFVITGLLAAGADPTDADIVKSIDWLRGQQNADGGWGETVRLASNAYGTGQALYAYKAGGVEISDESFRNGVLWLLGQQKPGGYWEQTNSQQDSSSRASNFATTMWAVIGLGEVFDEQTEEVFISLIHPDSGAGSAPGPGGIAVFLLLPALLIGPLWWRRRGERGIGIRQEQRGGGQSE